MQALTNCKLHCRHVHLSGAAFFFPHADHPVLAMSNFHQGRYHFTQDLLTLESTSPPLPHTTAPWSTPPTTRLEQSTSLAA